MTAVTAVDEPCTVTVGGQTQSGQVVSLSVGGAMITGLTGLGAADHGSLRLDRHGVQIGFEVRSLYGDAVHVEFAEADSSAPAFTGVIERLTHGFSRSTPCPSAQWLELGVGPVRRLQNRPPSSPIGTVGQRRAESGARAFLVHPFSRMAGGAGCPEALPATRPARRRVPSAP